MPTKRNGSRDGEELAPAIGMGPSMVVTGNEFWTEQNRDALESQLDPQMRARLACFKAKVANQLSSRGATSALQMTPFKPKKYDGVLEEAESNLIALYDNGYLNGSAEVNALKADRDKAVQERNDAVAACNALQVKFDQLMVLTRNLLLNTCAASHGPPARDARGSDGHPHPDADAEEADADGDGQSGWTGGL